MDLGKALGVFEFVKERVAEPSSHAALAAMFALAGQQYPDAEINGAFNLLSIVFGVLGFWVKEAKPVSKV